MSLEDSKGFGTGRSVPDEKCVADGVCHLILNCIPFIDADTAVHAAEWRSSRLKLLLFSDLHLKSSTIDARQYRMPSFQARSSKIGSQGSRTSLLQQVSLPMAEAQESAYLRSCADLCNVSLVFYQAEH